MALTTKLDSGLQVVQLYRDYLLNFMINQNQDRATAKASVPANTTGAPA